LENSSRDEGVEQADDSIVDIPKAADPYLAYENNSNRNKRSKECSSPFIQLVFLSIVQHNMI
jgi:hypothetical protein